MQIVYAGTALAVSAQIPAQNTIAMYQGLSFVTGECSLHDVPPLRQAWNTEKSNQVGCGASFNIKTDTYWEDMPIKFSDSPSDAALVIYESLNMSHTQSGSFRLSLPSGKGIYYFKALVKNFSYTDGGSNDSMQTRSGVLMLQSSPLWVLSEDTT